MKADRYFQNREMTQKALARYSRVVGGKGEKAWSIAESKLALYRHADIAYGDAEESARSSKHEEIFEHLRKWYGVGRNGTLWNARKMFDVLNRTCLAVRRSNGLTLPGLEHKSNQEAVVGCLKAVRGLKRLRSGAYPIMAASKNLHFFNPSLFAIYDNDIVLKKVYRVFREDWDSGYGATTAAIGDDGIAFYMAYLLWGRRLVENAHASFMDDFANWFVAAVKNEGEDAESYRNDLESFFATAFEFVVIGAAHLEASGKGCK